MTINEAQLQLSMQKFYVLGKDYEAVQVAIETMRKYQKIQEIVRWNNAPSPYYKPDGELFREICEVLENENNTRTD